MREKQPMENEKQYVCLKCWAVWSDIYDLVNQTCPHCGEWAKIKEVKDV